MTTRLVLLRHGESLGNKENRFTGWTDVDLSQMGAAEAREAGRVLKEAGFVFDIAFTSLLRRAIKTAWLALDEMGLHWIPIVKSWRLNERHLGELEGLTRSEDAKKCLAYAMRRNDIPLPKLEKDNPRHPRNDPRYGHLKEGELPNGESQSESLKRLLPYWQHTITPKIRSGQRVLIVSHGAIIRTLIMHLNHVNDEEPPNIRVLLTGTAIIIELDDQMNPVSQKYLGRSSIA